MSQREGGVALGWSPVNPDYRAVVEQSLAKQGLLVRLGARLESVAPGEVVIALPAGPDVTQQAGFVHGGALGAIGDSAGGYAALTLMPAGSEVVTVEYKINFIRPAAGVEAVATGRVLRPGRSLTVCQVDVDMRDGNGGRQTVAILQATFLRV